MSDPVLELTALRRVPLRIESDVPFIATAFEIELSGAAATVSLRLHDHGHDQLIAELELAASPSAPSRILVDGSMIEVFDGTGTPFTTRAYPTLTSAWTLAVDTTVGVNAWLLDP